MSIAMYDLPEGRSLSIDQDPDPMDPRSYDCVGSMVGFNRHGPLYMDEHPEGGPFKTIEEFQEWYQDHLDEIHTILPVYILDHSGHWVSTTPFNDPWDSVQLGFIYVTKVKVEALELKEEDVKSILVEEVEALNKYISGEVYMAAITKTTVCEHCGSKRKEVQESLSNLYTIDLEDPSSDICQILSEEEVAFLQKKKPS